MFFLLRCAFWLGLTFSMMDWPGGTPVLPDAGALMRTATGELANACLAAPQTCMDGARKLEALRNLPLATPSPSPAPAASVVAASSRPNTRPGAYKLRASDFQPVWRGRG